MSSSLSAFFFFWWLMTLNPVNTLKHEVPAENPRNQSYRGCKSPRWCWGMKPASILYHWAVSPARNTYNLIWWEIVCVKSLVPPSLWWHKLVIPAISRLVGKDHCGSNWATLGVPKKPERHSETASQPPHPCPEINKKLSFVLLGLRLNYFKLVFGYSSTRNKF